ncbi:antiviral RADAR system adenosine triphosphatase RdrA [Shewanella chilikensis]|uniref:antiviral RADAR system adenosine triphosphatase RdrA n=1 Tax=Shewanella chilikensis TaxID=558541 RepID=UPI0039998175
MSQKKRYIPLNAGESAVLPDANTLLPRNEVYEPLAQMIIEAVVKAKAAAGRPLNELREHSAISIDGARGTGKTAVLVNLKSYLKDRDVLKDVHIFDPVDPTLLEDGDSLFLHIIVAAVLHDKDVKEAQRNEPNKARSLNQTLEKLAQSLESVDTQQHSHGMDKVRAMYSNKQLADCVQDFFREVLGLLGKQLLILPIDDVDTSLNRAFENLEIVRRYLATPYVLPIVCGDRELYNDVTWRDFHGRLTKDSSYRRKEAYDRAVELAAEYQRKILPFPRRLSMPPVSKYWQQSNIYLRDSQQAEVMPLRNFIAWMEIFLSGPVNGLGDSQLPLPIPSMRALTQLLNRCHQLIPALPKTVREADSVLQVKRAWQMPDVPVKAIEEFAKEYQKRHMDEKREYGSAYAKFSEFAKRSSATDTNLGESNVDREEWVSSLEKHFRYESTGGAAYLVLLAKRHWQQWQDAEAGRRSGSIFDTPLFQPRLHGNVNYQDFERNHDLSDWEDSLKEKLPKVWFRDLSGLKTILPYPLAEVGCNINGHLQNQLTDSRKENNQNWLVALGKVSEGFNSNENLSRKAALLLNLLAEYYFYTPTGRTFVLNIGRIFELIIASLLGEVELSDLKRILHSAPFFSAKSQVQDIAVSDQKDADDSSGIGEGGNHEVTGDPLDVALGELQQEIVQWRDEHAIAQLDISPWLIYKVFEKVYAMVSDNGDHGNGESNLVVALNKAGLVFYATWSVFGSFEKGQLFGLPELVTGVALRKATNFEQHDHFKMNIGHLAPHKRHLVEVPDGVKENDKTNTGNNRREFGAKTRTITNALAYHPLGTLIDEVMRLVDVKNPKNKSEDKVKKNADWHYLLGQLGLSLRVRSENTLKKAAAKKSKDERHQIQSYMQENYPSCESTTKFEKICVELDQKEPSGTLNQEPSVDSVQIQTPAGSGQPLSNEPEQGSE